MFILREITSGKLQINTFLDIEYVSVMKEKNKDEFEERTKLWSNEDLKDIYGVVCFNDGESLMPLHKGSSYYIMTESGKTFEKL